MIKLAHAVVDETTDEGLREKQKLHLKQQKEEEIRMKLSAFARELAEEREARRQKKKS